MKPTRLLASLFAMALLGASASAQEPTGTITINLQNGWAINTNFSTFSDSDFQFVTGGDPGDQLQVNAFCNSGIGPTVANRAQSNVLGTRTGNQAMSASASAFIENANMSFTRPGNPGTMTSTATCTPSGSLGAQQSINMSGSSRISFRLGVFGSVPPIVEETISSAVVTPPGVGGKIGSPYNRLTLTQGPTRAPNFGLRTAFYYSQTLEAQASATLPQVPSAAFNTNVFADAMITLN